MSFVTVNYYFFFGAVLLIYILLPHRLQNILLLIASYFFYAYWNLSFTYLLLLTTVIDFYAGLKIAEANSKRAKRFFFFISLGSNLLILFTFKYGNVFIDCYNALLKTYGNNGHIVALKIFFPVGISFYVFQSLSYTIDIYRGFTKPTKNFINYALFISFFPQLIAGPIERSHHMLPQIENKRTFSFENVKIGAHLIFWGLFQKLFVADTLALFVRDMGTHPTAYSGGELLVGLYATAFQGLADISGYTDIARGTARILGFDLVKNFNLPYFASNISSFWNRWHMSVTGWFRDYVYFPIFAATRGKTHISVLTLLICIALWHSLSLQSFLRGLYFGLAIIAYHFLKRFFFQRRSETTAGWPDKVLTVFGILITFHLVCFGILFLIQVTPMQMLHLPVHIFTTFNFGVYATNLLRIAPFVAPLLIVHILQAITKDDLFILKQGFIPKVAFYWLAFLLLYGVGVIARPFIYYQY